MRRKTGNRYRLRGQGGFSLVEAVVVLVLLGVLLAAGLPAWQRNVAYNRLVMSQLVVVEDLRAAEQRARAEREVVCVVLQAGQGRLEVRRGGCDGTVVQVTDLPSGITPAQEYRVEYNVVGRTTQDVTLVLQDAYGRTKSVEVRRDGRVEAVP